MKILTENFQVRNILKMWYLLMRVEASNNCSTSFYTKIWLLSFVHCGHNVLPPITKCSALSFPPYRLRWQGEVQLPDNYWNCPADDRQVKRTTWKKGIEMSCLKALLNCIIPSFLLLLFVAYKDGYTYLCMMTFLLPHKHALTLIAPKVLCEQF